MSELSVLKKRIQSALSTSLLHPGWKSVTKCSGDIKLSGHCYAASEALYYLWGKKNGFKPHRIEVDDPVLGWVGHWYLAKGKQVADVTAKQFGFKIDYSAGTRCGFLTKAPSKRARAIMEVLGHSYYCIRYSGVGWHARCVVSAIECFIRRAFDVGIQQTRILTRAAREALRDARD